MLKKTKKLTLNLKILRFFIIPTILVSTPFLITSKMLKQGWNFSGIKTLDLDD